MAASTTVVTDEQVASFQEQGFLKVEHALGPEEVAAFRAALAEATARPGQGYFYSQGAQYTQHVNVWTTHEGVRRFVFNPALAEIARRLSRAAHVRLWHDQEIIKMPGNGPSTWHQDLPLWPMREPGPLTCWIALVDVPVEMGCMSFLPGSQRWGRIDLSKAPREALARLDGYRALVPEGERAAEPVTVPVTAGSCTFHDSLVLHYAGPNRTDRPREGFIINYMPDTITYNGQRHPTSDPLGLAVGQPIAGDLFPVLAGT